MRACRHPCIQSRATNFICVSRMNSFKSTERSLTLLKASRSCSNNLKVLCNKETSNNRKFHATKSGPRNWRGSSRVPKIKLYTGLQLTSTRFLSSPPIDQPLLNPKKLSPDETKCLVTSPIVPKTLSKFPKKVTDIPSVTKVLGATMPAASKFILDRWKESMIKKLGVAGFNKYQLETFERGRALHALVAHYLLGKGMPSVGEAELSTEIVSNLWKSVQSVVLNKITNVRLVEHIVTHPELNYRGIVDCVAFYEKELVVIDFKTAEKPKKNLESLYDNPLQVSAYCGALNNDPNIPEYIIDRNITSGLVIVAYVDGSEASTHILGRDEIATKYWKQWINRLDQFVRMEEMEKKIKRVPIKS